MSKSKSSSSNTSSIGDDGIYSSSYNKRSSYYAVLCAINFTIFFIYGTNTNNKNNNNANTNANTTRLCEKMLITIYMCNTIMWW